MSITPYAIGAARAVRVTAMIAALVMLVAFVAMQAFSAQYGARASAVVDGSRASDGPVATAVAHQERSGLQCSIRPTMTDVVLVQRVEDGSISTMSFADAITSSAQRTGIIRSFCV